MVPYSEVVREMGIRKVNEAYLPNYNASPGQHVPSVMVLDEVRVLDSLKWGLIPSWAKDKEIGSRMINARAETLAEKPAFRKPFASQRCVIIADGFYEWKDAGSGKIPYYVRLRDRRSFGFAGLWDTWRPPEGSAIKSCTIITVNPNDALKGIHDRMPAILKKGDEGKWVEPDNGDREELLSLLRPYDSRETEAYEVSKLVNSPENNSPECMKPVKKGSEGLGKFI